LAAQRYSIAFLTDQWEWEARLAEATLAEATVAARWALEELVREEAPQVACVTLLRDGLRVGVWDWVEQQAYWTPL